MTGTDATPLVISDRGYEGFVRGLLWRSPVYAAIPIVAAGLIAWLVMWRRGQSPYCSRATSSSPRSASRSSGASMSS